VSVSRIKSDEQHRRAVEELVRTDREPERSEPKRRELEGEVGRYQLGRELRPAKGQPKPRRS
jgi:hypothetical protein